MSADSGVIRAWRAPVGKTTSLMYLKTLKSELPEEERERLNTNLLEYNRVDTLAKVRLLEELYRAAG